MKKIISIILAMSLLTLSGCTSNDEPNPSDVNKKLTDVTVILDFVANTNHTGMYVALKNGYYQELGLNVEIIEPTEGATATLIAVGKGDFGISYQEDVTLAKLSEDALPIKAIATIIQNNTSGFVSVKDKNITSPTDFVGKTYAGWGGPGESAILEAVMKQSGADFNELDMIISDGSGLEGLKGDVDINWYYEGWDCINAEIENVDLNYMALRDLDERLNYYTPVIITNDEMIENSPEIIKNFLSATEKGYRYAIENPEESAEILLEYAPTFDVEFLKKSQIYLSNEYMKDTDVWGSMKSKVWDNYTEFLLEYGVISQSISSDELFTNEFLAD